jgi:hypothetical protein
VGINLQAVGGGRVWLAAEAVYGRRLLDEMLLADIDRFYSKRFPASGECRVFSRFQARKSFPFCNILAYTDNRLIIINILASERLQQISFFVFIYILGHTCNLLVFFYNFEARALKIVTH